MILGNLNNNNDKVVLFLFFIHPFTALLLAFNNLRSKYSFVVFFLFSILFGYTFIAQNETADSFDYVKKFNHYKEVASEKYEKDIAQYLTLDSKISDIYDITSYYLVSSVSDSYHLLFALWAFVFSFFFLKAFRFFVNRPEFNKSLIVYIIAFFFFFSNPISNINGVRFWTAAWIAVYAIFEIVINKNNRYVLLAFITPLIHISYLSFIGVLLVYLITIKYDKLWVIIFIITFFLGNIAIELVQNSSDSLPTALQNMIWSYTESSLAQKRMEGIDIALYAKILNKLPYFFINALIFIFIAKSKNIKQSKDAYSAYLFLLIWMSFVNFTLPIPSFGARFFFLGIPIVMYISLIMYNQIIHC